MTSHFSNLCNDFCKGSFYCPSLFDIDSVDLTSDANVQQTCPSCPDATPFFCESKEECMSSLSDCAGQGGGMSVGGVFGLILFLGAIAGGGFFVYWKRAKMQMRDEVRNILSEYMPLEEFQGGETSTVGLI